MLCDQRNALNKQMYMHYMNKYISCIELKKPHLQIALVKELAGNLFSNESLYFPRLGNG